MLLSTHTHNLLDKEETNQISLLLRTLIRLNPLCSNALLSSAIETPFREDNFISVALQICFMRQECSALGDSQLFMDTFGAIRASQLKILNGPCLEIKSSISFDSIVTESASLHAICSNCGAALGRTMETLRKYRERI